jgi:hypothetical protein
LFQKQHTGTLKLVSASLVFLVRSSWIDFLGTLFFTAKRLVVLKNCPQMENTGVICPDYLHSLRAFSKQLNKNKNEQNLMQYLNNEQI